jgi:hypothetical protein
MSSVLPIQLKQKGKDYPQPIQPTFQKPPQTAPYYANTTR